MSFAAETFSSKFITLLIKHRRNILILIYKFSGGKLVDVTPEIEKERQAELDRVKKQFNIKGDPTEFPKFKFQGMLIFQTINCNI